METHTDYKVLITTSGIGSRLGELTRYRNKALVAIGDKPAISHIIESYPATVEFIVTIGYYKEQLREFLPLAYPDRMFTFVDVDLYKGEGSSLAYSLYQARDHLQCPFIFHASDTIVQDVIPQPTVNWVGGFKGDNFKDYRSFNVIRGSVQFIEDKGAMNTDFIHIGLVGVLQFEIFWNALEKILLRNADNELGDVDVINELINSNITFSFYEFDRWYDVGNVVSIKNALQTFQQSKNILSKNQESVFLFDDFVVKFFFDSTIITNRLKRAKYLQNVIPRIENTSKYFYRYSYIKGEMLSHVLTSKLLKQFLQWLELNLWVDKISVSKQDFSERCYAFYYDKTLERVNKFLCSRGLQDSSSIINTEEVPTIKDIFSTLDFNLLSDGIQAGFHGDLVLDNVIKTNDSFCLIDWRQDFSGLYNAGDQYYDFAKLNHSLIVNHEIINRNLFTIRSEKNGHIECDILRKNTFVQCQNDLFCYLQDRGYNTKKVKLITALIWLNMAPLHHHPFDLFLYYFGKLKLWQEINI